MRVFVGNGDYPEVTRALMEAGATIVSSIGEAEGFVFTQTPGTDFPELPDSVRWVQLPNAGINAYFESGVITANRRWSNASGVYGRQVAEAAIALLLGLLHKHPVMVRADSWSPQPRVDASTTWLNGAHVAIIGAGGIGRHVAAMLRPFGARSIAVTRTGLPDGDFDSVASISELQTVLAEADHVIVCVPLTRDTRGLVGEREFAAMKPTANIINVARGEVIDTAALCDALDAHLIAGAGLDVTDPEPLPDDHPLWGRENVLITPHSANTIASMDSMLAPVVAENYRLLMEGGRMLTEVDVDKGY
ncbi:D-isomer specific 2-hydroxyacid dehydrogenase family protein [Corynebacterium pacaense]|uniref:D-isomer specific 2-hydroxyacid dehydrogenase family protein n=1 Tax=Corynebacterium pacaense TaxID=1816684 RepID=UPI0009BC5DBF|nr:D-isomer specific 2-hydroxyacid dehydrogenase family protein [Corynebacterium pacaense]